LRSAANLAGGPALGAAGAGLSSSMTWEGMPQALHMIRLRSGAGHDHRNQTGKDAEIT
jgi:hypothetical protein